MKLLNSPLRHTPRNLEALEGRLLFAGGGLDTTFDGDGFRLDTPFNTTDNTAIVQQADGKYVVAASMSEAGGQQKQVLVRRYNADGSPDNTYGDGGVKVLNPGGTRDDIPADIAIDANGNTYICGISGTLGDFQGEAFIISLDSTGQINNAFDGDGLKTFAGNDGAQVQDAAGHSAIEVVGNQLIVGGTDVSDFQFPLFRSQAYVMRMGLDGTPDTTFNQTGTAFPNTSTIFGIDALSDLKVQADGKIVVVGVNPKFDGTVKAFIRRLNADGTVDGTFAPGSGRIGVDFGRNFELFGSVAIDPATGNIYAAGFSADGLPTDVPSSLPLFGTLPPATVSDIAVAAFTSAGAAVKSFDRDGLLTTTVRSGSTRLGVGSEVLVQDDGKVVVAGVAQVPAGESDHVAIRYLANGKLDKTFGTNGIAVHNIGGSDGPFAAILDADDKIVAAGHARGGTNDQSVVRLDTADSAGAPASLAITAAQVLKLPANIIGGTRTAKGSVSVDVINNGGGATTTATTTQIFASTDTTLDGGDTLLGERTASTKINAGQTKTSKLNIAFGAVGVDTTFNLIAVITGGDVGAQGTQVISPAVEVEAPAITLNGTGTPAAVAAKVGKNKPFKFQLINAGNVIANAFGTFDFIFTTDGNEGTAVQTLQKTGVRLAITPGKSKTVSAVVLIPATGAANFIPPGAYTVLVRLVTAGSDPINSTDGAIVASIPTTLV